MNKGMNEQMNEWDPLSLVGKKNQSELPAISDL